MKARQIKNIFHYLEGQGAPRSLSIPFCVRLSGQSFAGFARNAKAGGVCRELFYQALRGERKFSGEMKAALQGIGITIK